MAKELNLISELDAKELAKHLRKPDGVSGKEVGLQMNKSNRCICLNSYKILNPKDGDNILEVGMANGFFIKDLLEAAKNLSYTGVDFSKTMVQEANVLNKKFIDQGKVKFHEASIEKLPFDNNVFDCIATVNTLYFWPKPVDNAKELLRVLKPGGKLLIGYRLKSFMDQLELSKYGFEKYDIQEVESLLKNAGFQKVKTQVIDEPEMDFNGEQFKMQGVYTECYKNAI